MIQEAELANRIYSNDRTPRQGEDGRVDDPAGRASALISAGYGSNGLKQAKEFIISGSSANKRQLQYLRQQQVGQAASHARLIRGGSELSRQNEGLFAKKSGTAGGQLAVVVAPEANYQMAKQNSIVIEKAMRSTALDLVDGGMAGDSVSKNYLKSASH